MVKKRLILQDFGKIKKKQNKTKQRKKEKNLPKRKIWVGRAHKKGFLFCFVLFFCLIAIFFPADWGRGSQGEGDRASVMGEVNLTPFRATTECNQVKIAFAQLVLKVVLLYILMPKCFKFLQILIEYCK